MTLLRLAHGKANAMSLEFCEALTARFAALSPGRAVVLTAGGHIFSAGVDLLRVSEGGAPYIRKFLPALSTMLSTVFSHPGSVVAAFNGHAIAGGCVLACAADRRLMARDGGRIGVTELLVGVPRFPFPEDEQHSSTSDYPGLVRAADLIGQVADVNYLRKIPALFAEFRETGVNEKLGFRNPEDMRTGRGLRPSPA